MFKGRVKNLLYKFGRAVSIISEDAYFRFLVVATPRIIDNNGESLFMKRSRLWKLTGFQKIMNRNINNTA